MKSLKIYFSIALFFCLQRVLLLACFSILNESKILHKTFTKVIQSISQNSSLKNHSH